MIDPAHGVRRGDGGPSQIDLIAEDWVDSVVRHRPTVGTRLGRRHSNDVLGDFSPDGLAAQEKDARDTLSRLAIAQPGSANDEVTRRALGEQLELAIDTAAARLPLRNLNVIDSPVQEIRGSFDLMPKDTEAQWVSVSRRLDAVDAALAGYQATLRAGLDAGVSPAARQIREVAAQALRYAAPDGFFGGLHTLASAPTRNSGALPASLLRDLETAANRARAAYTEMAEFLVSELGPVAPDRDAVGREHYELASRGFLGARVDLDESYEWGREKLAKTIEEQHRVAQELVPGGTLAEAIVRLETDPARRLHGVSALQRWMQETSDDAVAALAASQFDVPEPLRRLECMIAPTHEGGIYYTGPSDDLSRPGQMWWSVPRGVTEFGTWRERTTVYHEGVPGHHLQIGTGALNRDALNSWRRHLSWTSGHGEGWALYAERLMEQLGFLEDPGDRLGMLDAQRMRAARVVLDLGVHLGKRRPDGAGVWDADYALEFLRNNVTMSKPATRFELNRYLGWPGQAPSYSLGQRVWERLRDEAQARDGSDFDIRDFHREALSLGGLGLDTLSWALSRDNRSKHSPGASG